MCQRIALICLTFMAMAFMAGALMAEPLRGVRLLMAEEDGCYWCAQWHEEIAHIYPKTAEGRAAPLLRYDLHGAAPGVQFARSVHFTPTYILTVDGQERGRIEGYPGADFFWGLLATMMEKAQIPLEPES